VVKAHMLSRMAGVVSNAALTWTVGSVGKEKGDADMIDFL